MPEGRFGRIGLAISAADPKRVYALLDNETKPGLYRSDDRGANWYFINDNPVITTRPFYFFHLTADPSNADILWAPANKLQRSADGGKTWEMIPSAKDDFHAIWIDPKNTDRIIVTCDGGTIVSLNGGKIWSSYTNQSGTQMYRVDTDDQFPYRVYGNPQDLIAYSVPSASRWGGIAFHETDFISAGETGSVIPKPGDPNIVYSLAAGSMYGSGGQFTVNDLKTGQDESRSPWPQVLYGTPASEFKYRFNWFAPFFVSPHDPNTIYMAGNVVFRTRDEGLNWDVISPDLTHNGGSDAFVAEIEADGASLDFCGYVGGKNHDVAFGIDADADGRAYLVGNTDSDEQTFPVIVGPDLTQNGNTDLFVARLASSGESLEYCGFLGGARNENGLDVAVDALGRAHITGWTYSSNGTFPVLVGPDTVFRGKSDAFVARLDASGASLEYCGFIGGTEEDFGLSLALDEAGCAYVGGGTFSEEDTFPVLVGPDLTYNGSGWDVGDAFLAKVNAQGTGLLFCGYVGGADNDGAYGLALDGERAVYLTGWSLSDEASFPVKTGPDLTYNGGTEWVGDGFVVKAPHPALTASPYTLPETGGAAELHLVAGAAQAGRHYLILAGLSGTEPGFLLPGEAAVLPLNWDAFTDFALSLVNSPLFSDFLGSLNGAGNGTALLAAPALPPGYTGVQIFFAYCLNAPFDFASNAVTVKIIP